MNKRRALMPCVASALVCITLLAATARSYRSPIVVEHVGGRLYGVVLRDGQVQVFRGTHTVVRYPPASAASTAPAMPKFVEVPWGEEIDRSGLSPPPPLVRVRLVMSSWPPLRQSASLLMGGSVTIPPQSTRPTKMMPVIKHGEFGWEFDARAFSAWLIVAVVFAPTLFFAARVLRRRVPGACPACGYDLRASPERCPECGRVAPVGGLVG